MPRLAWKVLVIALCYAAVGTGLCRADTIVYDDYVPVVSTWEPYDRDHVVHYYHDHGPRYVVYDEPEYFNDGSQRYEARPSYQTTEYFSSYYW